MRESRGLLILLVAVVLTAAIVYVVTRPEPPPPTAPAQPAAAPVPFSFTGVPVRSPDLEITDLRVAGHVTREYTSWMVAMTCAEAGGCVGELTVEIRFDGGDAADRVRLIGEVEAAAGEAMRLDGLQQGAREVAGIERVVIEFGEASPDSSPASGEVEL